MNMFKNKYEIKKTEDGVIFLFYCDLCYHTVSISGFNKDIHNISIMDSFVIENEEKIWIYNKINSDYIFNDGGYNFAYSLTSETVNIDKRVYMKEGK